jgi:uncharacterized membrane protein YjjB (DUF3815 family)
MSLLLKALGVLVGTAASAVLFNVPRSALLWAALAGLMGWAVQVRVGLNGVSPAAGALLGALTVSLTGEALARARRMPALVFVVPGILPLVPGTRAFQAMLALLRQDHGLAALEGAQALVAAGGIAVGLLMGTALTRAWGRPTPQVLPLSSPPPERPRKFRHRAVVLPLWKDRNDLSN